MKRKLICLLFLTIGSYILLLTNSCGKVMIDYMVDTNYYYINQSQYKIDMEIFNSDKVLIKKYTIPSSHTLMFTINAEGGAGPFQFGSDLREIGDSIYLAFSELRYLALRKNYDDIFFEKSYNKEKINDKEYNMYYTFTDNDYENAKEIE